ncbi:MAG: 3-phosphoshikimate 1-carboxyvinyltransferase [Clostridia bacterium]|nr:3-phosphoshikimate 1-carboxyvinyltransferase [Clostridia bacterium]
MNVNIKPGRLSGCIAAPPSKSYAHRLMIAAALANGESRVSGIAESQDMLATLDCIRALGVSYQVSADTVTFAGKGEESDAVFPCRESGSTLRFMLPIALLSGRTVVFTGAERLIERGIGVYEDLFSARNITFQKSQTAITISGKLSAGEYALPGDVSSQFVSGLLFALPLCAGDSTIRVLPPVESRPYIDITLDVLRRFGIEVTEEQKNVFFIRGGQQYRAQNVSVEGDWSNAAALLAFNNLGGNVQVTGLEPVSRQGDRVCVSLLSRLEKEKKPEIDLSDCPDLAPVLFAVAAATGGADFVGTRRLRIKESDRAGVMAEELLKFGIKTVVEENSVRIMSGKLQTPTERLSSHNDHRVVMALTLLCSITGGVIDGAQAVSKSFPDYFECLTQLGLEVCYET